VPVGNFDKLLTIDVRNGQYERRKNTVNHSKDRDDTILYNKINSGSRVLLAVEMCPNLREHSYSVQSDSMYSCQSKFYLPKSIERHAHLSCDRLKLGHVQLRIHERG